MTGEITVVLPRELAAARLRVVIDRPYLASALWSLVPVERPGLGTMAVDKYWRLYYDPKAMERWGLRGTATVLMHEVWHLLREHCWTVDPIAFPNHNLTNVCFPAGTLLPGGVPIESVATMTREYDGDMISIETQAGGVAATSNHKFFVKRRKHKVGLTPIRLDAPKMTPLDEVRVGDYVCVPKFKSWQQGSETEIDLSKMAMLVGGPWYHWHQTHSKMSIPLTPDTAWLIGLYTAEGSKSGGVVKISLGFKGSELELGQRAIGVAGSMG